MQMISSAEERGARGTSTMMVIMIELKGQIDTRMLTAE